MYISPTAFPDVRKGGLDGIVCSHGIDLKNGPESILGYAAYWSEEIPSGTSTCEQRDESYGDREVT